MAKIINTSDKEKMLTGIREASQGFRKDLDVKHDELIEVAKEAKYVRLDKVVNTSGALTLAITENMNALDDMLDDMAEVYLKQGVISESFANALKKFTDSKINLVGTYDTVNSPEGEENYDSEKQGVKFTETLQKVSQLRVEYLETISGLYKQCAGDDIADMVVPALKKVEDSCNEYVTELKKVIDELAATDERLASIQSGVGDLASSLKLNSVAEKKVEFGTVPSSGYVGDL